MLLSCLLVPVSGRGEEAAAGGLSVSPTRITLSGQQRTTLLALTNRGERPRRFQLTTHTWKQTADGQMELAPTEAVIAFPSLLILEPGKKRNVRVGVRVKPAIRERTFRLVLDELPPAEDERGQSPGVAVLTRMSIPVFLQPLEPQPDALLGRPVLSNSKLLFTVENAGNVHVMPRAVRVQGSDATGSVLIDKAMSGWYVLAGGKRKYELPLEPKECTKLAVVRVEADLGERVLKRQLAVNKASCAR